MKYKLIKTYPNCGIYVGYMVALFGNNYKALVANGQRIYFSKTEVENYPEYWEKVAEKDYEILCYKHGDGDIKSLEYLNESLKRGSIHEGWFIYSIKRLSDGVIFSIGDKIDGHSYTNRVILNIELVNKELLFRQCLGYSILEDIKHSKQPLFTTEDGVDIHLNDTFYSVTNHYTEDCEAFELQTTKKAKKHHIDFGNYEHTKHFSTKEKAEEYIIMNKPCLSIKDFKKTFNNPGTSIIEPLKELVKSKLNG